MGMNANGNLMMLKRATVVKAFAASRGSLEVAVYTAKTTMGRMIGVESIIIENPTAEMYASLGASEASVGGTEGKVSGKGCKGVCRAARVFVARQGIAALLRCLTS
jgi:hypothetical protein